MESKSSIKLRPNCLSFPEVLAQAVAVIAPTASPTVNIPLAYASSQSGTWFTYVIATVGLILVSLNINQFARHSASPGSLYTYITKGLGPTVGVLTGWALVLGYLGTAMAVLCGFANYGNVLLALVGLKASSIFLFAICAGIAWYFAYKDIRLSTTTMLIFEFTSVTLILLLAVIVLFKHGFAVDTSQIALKGATPEGIRLGLVLAVFSFVGFESSTALGAEAKNPLRTIPNSVLLSTILTGLFFIFLSYVEVLGFAGYSTSLDKSDAPLNVLTNLAGVGFLGILISAGAVISFFSCVLGCVNAAARILYAMARHGIFHDSVGMTHNRNETPHIAVTMTTVFVFLVPAAMSMFGIAELKAYDYAGTVAVYGFLLAYILISIAAPVYLYRKRELRIQHVITSAVAVLFMLFPVYGSLYPVPPSPYSVFPYLFLMLLLVGGIWFFMLRLHSPEVLEDMEGDLEEVIPSKVGNFFE